ncbi:unnamed protein product [Schistocephalus solidus]|uniref:Protein kinase domain-containing protein n=1 Tax=Schistocephalus solidus TaxID=70667 RepID=A0A3P7EJA0_SCHSO|nr:unnamed protein product [Schistocephalus solidus]
MRVGASADSTKTLTYIVGKLEHFTEYLFLISACHEPHDELGNPVFPSNRSDDYDDEVSLSPGSSDSHNTWCSPPVRISQRTQAIRYADEIDSRSLRALTPDARLSSMTNQTLPADSNEKAGVRQSESFIIGSQEAQRQPEADGPPPSNKQSVPWFTICVPPQYYKQQPKAAALTNATVVHLPPDDPVFGVSSSLPPPIRSAMEPPYLPSDLLCRTAAPPKIVFTDLPFLRPGFYEWQIMAVSLAGNGSWTDSHFFEVHDSRPESLSRTLKPVYSTLYLTTIHSSRRRLNALLSQNAEYLQSLLLDRFSDEWEVDPKDLTYDADAAIGHGSFGMVFRGRLTRLTTPAAEYLQVPLASAGPGGNKALKLERSSSNAGETTVDKGHSLATRYSVLLTLLRGHFSHLTKKTSSPPHAIGVDVAVKVLSPGSTLEDVREFLSEASHMKQFSCNHIVRLLGIVSKQLCLSVGPFLPALAIDCGPKTTTPPFLTSAYSSFVVQVLLRRQPIVIMELMEHGDLATYLRQRMAQDDYSEGCIAPELAIKWAAEIADGMAYLSFKGFVHRDLAARNCLVGSTLTVKIGDFGLTRDISDNHYYRKQGRARLPVRWMAPEALLEAYFTSKSDVW